MLLSNTCSTLWCILPLTKKRVIESLEKNQRKYLKQLQGFLDNTSSSGLRPQLILLYSLIICSTAYCNTRYRNRCSGAYFRVYMASQWFLSTFEYRLTCSFWRYCLLFLGTLTLTPEPVFCWTSTRGALVDRRIPN